MTVNQRAEQLRYAIQLFAKTLNEEDALKVATVFDNWKPDSYEYKKGDYCLFGENENGDPRLFKCLKDHISTSKKSPVKSKTLYKEIGVDKNNYPLYCPVTGVEDSYMNGDKVIFNGLLYQSAVNFNIYSPEIKPENWMLVDAPGISNAEKDAAQNTTSSKKKV